MRIDHKKAVWAGLLTLMSSAVSLSPAAAQEPEVVRKITKRIPPVYPPLAQQSRLSGTVKMLLVVSPEGGVKSLRTMGGNPVLITAAEQAVKQWKFVTAPKETTETVAVTFGLR